MPTTRRVALMLDLENLYKRHAGVFAGVMRYALENNWDPLVDEYVEETLPDRAAKDLPYDGIIARATTNLAKKAQLLHIPIVNIWLSSPAVDLLPGVFPDFQAGGKLRAEHLLSHGFRQFAAIISEDNQGHANELRGFTETLQAAGHTCQTASIPLMTTFSVNTWRKTERIITNFMDKWELPIGVYVGNEMDGRLVTQMCRVRGWRVPQDVAIITGSNEEIICEHIRPTLSSIEFGYERVGYEAAKLLANLMDGKPAPKKHVLLPPTGLVIRESTNFYSVENKLIAAALEFIANNSHLEIGADDVARAVNTQTRTLQRHFRKHLNRPIATEIRSVRIENAKRELTQSTDTLAQIAKKVGFGKAMLMYEVFRRELGVTPNQYRHERQRPND